MRKIDLKNYRAFILGAGLSALAASAAWGTWSVLHKQEGPVEVVKGNGRLEVQRVEIATKFAGRVLGVEVQEGQEVQAGDVIARLDPGDLQAQLNGVEAMRQRAMQAMSRAQGEIQVQSIKARVAQLELDNAAELRKQALVSDSELQRRQAQRDGERAGISIATSAQGEAKAARDEAEAGIKRLRLAIEDHTLRAPVAGRIEHRVVEPSSVIPAGGRVATLLDTSHAYMTIFLPTAVAGRLRVGDEARIILDAAPDLPLPATVSFVASEAQFTPRYVETSSEREKLTYRVKLALPEEVAQRHASLLKAGLTGIGQVRLRAAQQQEAQADPWAGDQERQARAAERDEDRGLARARAGEDVRSSDQRSERYSDGYGDRRSDRYRDPYEDRRGDRYQDRYEGGYGDRRQEPAGPHEQAREPESRAYADSRRLPLRWRDDDRSGPRDLRPEQAREAWRDTERDSRYREPYQVARDQATARDQGLRDAPSRGWPAAGR